MGQIALRYSALNPRERRFLIAGAAALAAFPLYLLVPRGVEPEAEIAGTVSRGFVPAFHPPEQATLPESGPTSPPSPAPTASLSGLVLRGVLGGGAAIIGLPDGSQRSVAIGREFLPGVTLKEVALHHIILATASGESRLEFNKPASETAPAAAAVVKTPEAERRSRETLEFRTGLVPLKENGRIRGFAIRPGTKLGIFQRAGLRPGDVIVSVNGQAFRSEEKVLELSGELASARAIEIDFLRGDRKMTGKIK